MTTPSTGSTTLTSQPSAPPAPSLVPGAPSPGASRLLESYKETNAGGRGLGQEGKRRGPYRQRGAPSQAAQPMAAPVNLFTEENTGRLVALPFRLAAVGTDYDGWLLDNTEQKELAITGSVCLNAWVSVDPKWVSLLLFSLSLAGIATAKAVGFQAEKKARAILAAKDKKPVIPESKETGTFAPAQANAI